MEEKRYPADFANRVKAEYPDRPDLHKALDSGNNFLGRYLDDGGGVGIRPEKIVEMIDQGQIEKLRQEADQLVRRGKLYAEWCEIADKMFYNR
jgi:hypothetical protein